MAETANIAKMAEKISSEIFSVFIWDVRGPTNQNWLCAQQELHNKTSHPSDVVFWYDEPYRNIRTYVQTDLKSYQSTSLGRSQIEAALISLAQQIACAEISEESQDLFTHQHVNFEIIGLLFIYNHDGAYDRTFSDILKSISFDQIHVPKGRRMFILGPQDIYWLNNVSHDIQWLRGRSRAPKLPKQELCSFYYPQLLEHRQIRGEKQCAATLEMLCSPWIIMKYLSDDGRTSGFIVYLKDKQASVDDFLYLIDYLRRSDMLHEALSVDIRYISKDAVNPVNFQSAQQQYAEQIAESVEGSTSLSAAVRAITMSPINNVISTFSEEAIGMEDVR